MNTSRFAPKTPEELQKQNWHRMDCLAKYKLANENDKSKLKAWFETQDQAWQESRQARFNSRLNERRW